MSPDVVLQFWLLFIVYLFRLFPSFVSNNWAVEQTLQEFKHPSQHSKSRFISSNTQPNSRKTKTHAAIACTVQLYTQLKWQKNLFTISHFSFALLFVFFWQVAFSFLIKFMVFVFKFSCFHIYGWFMFTIQVKSVEKTIFRVKKNSEKRTIGT